MKKTGCRVEDPTPSLLCRSEQCSDYLSAQHGLVQSSPQAFLAAAAAIGQLAALSALQVAAALQAAAALQPGSAVSLDLKGAKLLQPARAKLPNTTKTRANLRMLRSFQSDHE